MSFIGWLTGTSKRDADDSGVSRLQSRFGDSAPTQRETQRASGVDSAFNSTQAPLTEAGRFNIRKNLIRMVLRDTMLKMGIPTDWIGADVLVATSRTGGSSVHLRLLIQRWDQQLVLQAINIERQFQQRIVALDPMAPEWLRGISWKFSVEDDAQLPAIPHPASWTVRSGSGAVQVVPAASAVPEPIRRRA